MEQLAADTVSVVVSGAYGTSKNGDGAKRNGRAGRGGGSLGALQKPTDSDRWFRILVQGISGCAIFMLDPGGYVATWNPGAERIKGYAAGEILGSHFSRFYTPEDCAAGLAEAALRSAADTGRFEAEGWRLRKDGSRFWASVVLDRILDEHGNLLGFAKITRDMTETKLARDELEQARAVLAQSQKLEAVGQLTGGVAHDFNNLLTVITNALELLATCPNDEARRTRIIGTAMRASERGARLTQQLLTFARRQPLHPKVHNINTLILGFEAVLRQARPEPIELALTLCDAALASNIDAAQFETALLNLVLNARDAMPSGGTLRISTGLEVVDTARVLAMTTITPGRYARICVADNGTGMRPDVLARAFEPFYTTKEIGRGSGIGLSQVYGFVAQSGGHVIIDSVPSSGTTVTLYLPAADSTAAGDADHLGEADRPITNGKVLVVEDDPDVLAVTVESLRSIGYDVVAAMDGPSALSLLERERDVGILFSDVVMPQGMNGFELAQAATRLRPELRVLLASSYPNARATTTPVATVAGGDFPFLPKPYRAAELANALRALGGD